MTRYDIRMSALPHHRKGLVSNLQEYELMDEKSSLPGNQFVKIVGDENTAHVQIQASLLVVVVVQDAFWSSWRYEKDASELNVTFTFEVD